ncbi:hypothetical protein K505DRAFT_368844 [Melanomma pulvis-pyrius CBS 109.77]|uniref:Uncharacterized protein n=1 Tax=Melanomma pulvis-pyrius CBS 109.77 TaxID=1314802 RepID=A0A6A6WNR9_9PLEO|nr:hypothetical protein K505DRAFT_368844 [Melanomma pulvis-pyrius CBS 109.77]
MSQSPAESFTTIEDSTLYDGVYRVGVSREEKCGDEQSQPAVALADLHGRVLLRPGPVPHDAEHVDRSNKKRVHFDDSDSDYGRPSVKRKVSKAECLALTTAIKRMQDLEARVEALEEEKVKLVRVFQEWATMDEKAIQERAKRNKKFIQDLAALMEG